MYTTERGGEKERGIKRVGFALGNRRVAFFVLSFSFSFLVTEGRSSGERRNTSSGRFWVCTGRQQQPTWWRHSSPWRILVFSPIEKGKQSLYKECVSYTRWKSMQPRGRTDRQTRSLQKISILHTVHLDRNQRYVSFTFFLLPPNEIVRRKLPLLFFLPSHFSFFFFTK